MYVKIKLPINDEVPSGQRRPVILQCCPAVLQFQRYFGISGRHQLHLKIQWLLQVLPDRIVFVSVENTVGVV